MTAERRAPDAFFPELPVAPAGQGLVRASVFTLFKWKRMILSITLAFTLAGALYLVLRPPTSSAGARILLSGNPGLMHQVLRAEASRLTSREVLGPVAEILLANGTSHSDFGAVREALLAALQVRTDAQPIAEANFIRLTHSASPPDDPVRILQLIIDTYLAAHATKSSSHALVAFATQQHARARQDLHDSEEGLDRWRTANRIVSIDAAITSHLAVLAHREAALRDIEPEIEATRSKIAALERQLPAQPTHVTLQREHVTNPLIVTLRAELASAEAAFAVDRNTALVTKLKGDLVAAALALHELRQRYTDQDRRVQEKLEQVALLKRALASAEEEAALNARSRIARLTEELATAESQAEILGRQTVGLNPVRDQLERDLASATVILAALGSRKAALTAQVLEARDALADFRTKKLEEERLSSSVALARESLQFHAKKADEARLTAGAQHEFSRLSVLEQPYQLLAPGLLAHLKIAFLSCLAGLMISCGLAFGYEISTNALRSREDVEYYLAVPILAAIPDRTQGHDPKPSAGPDPPPLWRTR